MLSEKKTVMYIQMQTEVHESPFGALECSSKNIYEEHQDRIKNKVIVKIDCINGLRELLDEAMFMDRDNLYCLVSGSLKPGLEYGELLQSFYKKFVAFANYVDVAHMMMEDDQTLLQCIISPIRSRITAYKNLVIEELKERGGRFVLETHDYIYIAFDESKYEEIKDFDVEVVLNCTR